MMEVSKGKFDQVLDGMKFVEIQFHPKSNELWGSSKFYGVEVGNDVLIVQKWNNDFCTSSFRIPDAQIIKCGERYTVMPYAMDCENVNPKVKLDVRELPEPTDYDDSEDQEASLAERFAAIEGSASDEGPALSKAFYNNEMPSNAEVVLEAAKENVQVDIPTGERPVMTKGRAKPEEMENTPAPQKVVKRDKPEYVKPVKGPRNVEPEPAPKPKFDFGDW